MYVRIYRYINNLSQDFVIVINHFLDCCIIAETIIIERTMYCMYRVQQVY